MQPQSSLWRQQNLRGYKTLTIRWAILLLKFKITAKPCGRKSRLFCYFHYYRNKKTASAETYNNDDDDDGDEPL
jgi:hypothetical protein